jgi:ABC-type branched-subunit amino acid transport system substrate-binding protein
MVAFAASDALTGISPYFFRVSAPTLRQASVGAQYAERTLHAKRAAVFVDSTNSFSSSLAKDFVKQFQADGNRIVATEHYTIGKPSTLIAPLKDALNANPAPDMIYFAGYASDVSTVLTNLPTSGPLANLPVVGANALYELGGYQSSAHAALFHLHFTALAYPDEWDILEPAAQKPSFFTNYPNAFDPNRLHQGSPYGYTRASADAILSYDALLSILTASTIALTNERQSTTPNDLQQALTKISGNQAIQGVSGQISFESNGNPGNKVILVVCVDRDGRFHLTEANGQFLVGGEVKSITNLTTSCS